MQRSIMVFALGFGMCQIGIAQAPASAPSGSTGVCKDGSYTNAASKAGACRGHTGVQSWFAADASAAKPSAKSTKEAKPSAAATPPAPVAAAAPVSAAAAAAPAAAQATTPKATKTTAANMAQGPGGGPGTVWVNTATKVYHCSGSSFYGKTKEGKYMTEAEAKAAGAHPDHGKACGQ
jgi:hypothetical protein